jgi:hypothetical protein
MGKETTHNIGAWYGWPRPYGCSLNILASIGNLHILLQSAHKYPRIFHKWWFPEIHKTRFHVDCDINISWKTKLDDNPMKPNDNSEKSSIKSVNIWIYHLASASSEFTARIYAVVDDEGWWWNYSRDAHSSAKATTMRTAAFAASPMPSR